MSDSNHHVSKLSIDELLLRAIEQGNGASRSEIMRRRIERKPTPNMGDFLLEELMIVRGISPSSASAFNPTSSSNPDLDGIDLSDNPDEICIMARQFLRAGFTGQNMRDSDRAHTYIGMAAQNPRVMDELPESGRAFYKSAEFNFRAWKFKREQRS
jgi:hypothetical protein